MAENLKKAVVHVSMDWIFLEDELGTKLKWLLAFNVKE
jgi:hypothetical protein